MDLLPIHTLAEQHWVGLLEVEAASERQARFELELSLCNWQLRVRVIFHGPADLIISRCSSEISIAVICLLISLFVRLNCSFSNLSMLLS